MLEVEVKAQVKDKTLLEDRLSTEGILLSESRTQIDHVFVKDVSSVEAFYKNAIFIRIREQDNEAPMLTLKKKRQELASLEYETEIESTAAMSHILEQLDFVHALTIRKTRAKARHGEYTICIDDVEGLGTFIEIEKLVEDGDIKSIQSELFAFLQSLGVTENERVLDAYDTLLLKKKFEII